MLDIEDDGPIVHLPFGIEALAFSPDGKTLAIRAGAVDEDAPVTFWDVEETFGLIVDL